MMHLVLLSGCLTAVIAFVAVGRVAQAGGWSRRFERTAGWASLAILSYMYFCYWQLFRDAQIFLPLHLCTLSELAACASLLTRRRGFRSILYFWSFGAVLAMLTPEAPAGPETVVFWLFWFSHAFIPGVVLYELVVAGFRPGLRDLGWAIAVTLLYVAVVLPVDIAWGFNFGFVGPSEPSVPTLIDYLGPWPLRVLWMVLIGLTVFVLAWLPWAVFAREQAASERNVPHAKTR